MLHNYSKTLYDSQILKQNERNKIGKRKLTD